MAQIRVEVKVDKITRNVWKCSPRPRSSSVSFVRMHRSRMREMSQLPHVVCLSVTALPTTLLGFHASPVELTLSRLRHSLLAVPPFV